MANTDALGPMENTLSHTTRHYPPPGFGDALRRGRAARGLGLRAAARAAGLTPGYLSLLEHGHRSPSESVAELLVDTLRLTGDDAELVESAGIPDVGRDWRGGLPASLGLSRNKVTG